MLIIALVVEAWEFVDVACVHVWKGAWNSGSESDECFDEYEIVE